MKRIPAISAWIVFFLTPFGTIRGQEMLTSDQYFRNVLEEFDQLQQRYTQSDFRASWLDKIDLRTETEDFDPDRQRYLLRLSPSTGKIRKAQSQLHRQYRAEALLEWEEERSDWVINAYVNWLDLYDKTRNLELLRQLLVVLTDQQQVIQKLALASEISVKEVIEIQRDINEVRIDIFSLEQELVSITPGTGNPDFSDLISLPAIRQKAQQTEAYPFTPQYPELEQDLQTAESEIQLEKAEGKRFFDFLQLEYNGPHLDPWREKLRIGLGVNIPLASDRKLKIEELNMEKRMIEQQSILAGNSGSRKFVQQLSGLAALFETLDYATGLLESSNQQSADIVAKSSPESLSTPLRQLYQKELEIKNELQLQDLQQDIYEEYVALLVINQLLFQRPFVNYLKRE